MLYIKIQPQSFLGSWEEDFKAFLRCKGMYVLRPFCSEVLNHLDELSMPRGKSGEKWSSGYREEDIRRLHVLAHLSRRHRMSYYFHLPSYVRPLTP